MQKVSSMGNPERNVPAMQPVLWKRPLPVWVYPVAVVGLFMTAIAAGMVTGNWNSSLTYSDYQSLMPIVPSLSH